MSLSVLAAKGISVVKESRARLNRSRPKKETKVYAAKIAALYFSEDTGRIFERIVCKGVSPCNIYELQEALHRLYVLDEMLVLAKINYSPVREIYQSMVGTIGSIQFYEASVETETFLIDMEVVQKMMSKLARKFKLGEVHLS